ncbi:MAG: alpha/beta hydrolase [Eubacteriales bacterium]|nr:alpha/beta hydrolase [Eubacteriales bacterium]
MNTFRKNIWKQEEYHYKAAYGFMPNIHAYLHDDEEIRPCMLVVPGGGYCMVVPPEAEIVAMEFYNRGMNAFVLTYTTDITMSVPLKKQPLNDVSRAIRVIRKHCEEYKIDPNRITIYGGSAGGHVSASLCTHFEDVVDPDEALQKISNRPDAAILSYPVITTGEYTHIYSVQALLGKEPTEEELEYFSLEKQVTENTPPCFVWQTVEDDLVPVENSYLFAASLRKKGVPYAHMVFPNGNHGLSVASDAFFKGEFGEPYTFEQLDRTLEHIKNHTAIDVSEERYAELMEQFFGENTNQENGSQDDAKTQQEFENPYPDVNMWMDMADIWLKRLWKN